MPRKVTFPDWRKWLPTLGPDIELRPPAGAATIDAAERDLAVEFPEALRSLLLASDGVADSYALWHVWPAAKITSENRDYRSNQSLKDLYMPFDHLLFIGEAGNGDLFAYPIMADGNTRCRRDIFRWDHETDERVWVAGSLELYLKGFIDGSIDA